MSIDATAVAARTAPLRQRLHERLRADADHTLLSSALADRQPSRYERFGKPVLDRLVAAAALLVLTPILLLVSIAVLVSLGRPVLFRQQRVGADHRVFEVLKFRTMRPDRRGLESRRHWDGVERRRTHKHPEDPRLTLIGRFLRASSLDELPQLVNVLRGEMSLVGPRPEILPIVDRYEDWQHRRHLVRPGLTGLWQVTERGNGTLMHERVEVDLAYVQHLSPRLDLAIALRTVPILLSSRRGH